MENNNNGLGNEARLSAGFERVKGDLAALAPEQLQQVSLDITAAFATVMGVLPEVQALRERIVKELPTFNIARFDKLGDYALALGFAQSKYLSATQPPDDLEPLAEQLSKYRELLLAEVTTLTHHGVVSSAQLANLKGANGKKNVATDVWVLSRLMLDNWEKIQGRSLSTVEDLENAANTATRVLEIIGRREQGPAVVAEASERRLRAYTQLLLAYEDAQLAVAYLRGTKYDADTIIPNLHPGRRGSARKKQDEPTEVPDGSVPAAEPTTTAPAPSAPAAPATNNSALIAKDGPFAH